MGNKKISYAAIRPVLAKTVQFLRYQYYKAKGYNIHRSTQMERNLNLDRLNPKGIYIGRNTIITSGVTILSHKLIPIKSQDKYIGRNVDTRIGDFCVIGTGAIILSGITIGNDVVVAAGSVVTKDIPSNTIVGGNPAKVIKANIQMENIEL
jgi:acetyltransferase-like isoleucine patch superfamily enzyme